MKKLFLLLRFFIVVLVMMGCKKETRIASGNMVTFNVINGVINKTTIIKVNGGINNSGMDLNGGNQTRINFRSNMLFFNEAKSTTVAILNSADSSVLVTKNVDFKQGGIYTMLLAGIAPNAEAVVIDDSNIPNVNLSKMPANADSVINVRFVNLIPDVQPLSVRLAGGSVNEFNGLAYKGYTQFKAYPAKVKDSWGTIGYSILNFEFVENGNVVATYDLYVYEPWNRYKNLALVISGMKTPGSGQPSLQVSEAYYFQ